MASFVCSRPGTGVLLLSLLLAWYNAAGDANGRSERSGEYIFKLAGCAGCHTRKEKGAMALAGGRRIETRFGIFYSPNITPDPEHGIGRWSVDDLARALRKGESPQGVHLYPVFPYTSYAGMVDEDVHALMSYLKSVPGVNRADLPYELPWYLRFRPILYVWKLLFHSRKPFEARKDKSPAWNRGDYLVNVLGHCGECHTPRNLFGALDPKRHLAGNQDGPEGDPVPNITPDPESGIGEWSDREIRDYLKNGLMPDGDVAGGIMAEVIDESLRFLTDDDLEAMVIYLRSVPALKN